MNQRQLENLAANPNYTLSPKQAKELEEYQRQSNQSSIKVTKRKRSKQKKHSTEFLKHEYQLEKEETPNDNKRVRRSKVSVSDKRQSSQ